MPKLRVKQPKVNHSKAALGIRQLQVQVVLLGLKKLQ
jgi:hypothetical protein